MTSDKKLELNSLKKADLISAFRELEAKFSEQQERLKHLEQLVNTSGDDYWQIDLEGNVQYASISVKGIFGYTPEEAKNLNFADFFTNDALAIAKETFGKALSGVEKQELIIPAQTKEGNIVHTALIVLPLYRNGKIEGVQGIAKDITKIENYKKAFETSEIRYKSLFENMKMAFALHELVTDENNNPVDYIFVEVNNEFGKLTGLNSHEIIGKRVTEVLPGTETESADWIGTYGKVVQTGESINFDQYSETIGKWFSITAYKAGDKQFAVIFHDISKIKETNLQLERTIENLAVTLKSIGDGVIITDTNSTVTNINRAAEQLTKWSLEEAVGQELTQVLNIINSETRQPAFNPVRHVLETGKTIGLANHTSLICKDGSEIHIADSAAPIKSGTGEIIGAVVVFRDATEEYTIREQLRMNQRRLSRAQEIAGVGSFEIDLRNHNVTASETAYKLYGLPQKEFDLKSIQQVPLPEYRQALDKALQDLIHHNTPYDIHFKIMRKSDGEKLDIHSIAEYDEENMMVYGTIRDETRQNAMINNMLASENRFHSMFERHNAVMLLIEPQTGKIVDGNNAAMKFYGYDLAELRAMTIQEINTLPPEKVREERLKALHENRNYFIFEHRLSNGQHRKVEVHSSPVNLRDQVMLFSIVFDVTERTIAENLLLESEEKYKRLIENSPDIVYIYSTLKGGMFWSSRVKDILGFDSETMKSEPFIWNQSIHHDDIDFVNKSIEELPTKKAFDIEYRVMDVNGNWHWFRDRTISFKQIDEELIMEGLATDITERKNAERTIQESKERLDRIFRNAPVGILITEKRRLKFMNKTLTDILGYSHDELLEQSTLSLYATEDDFNKMGEIINTTLKKQNSAATEVQLKTKNGIVLDTLINLSFLSPESLPDTIVATIQDITERKRLDSELHRISKLESLGVLAGGIAHNFKNLLTSMSLSAEIAKMKPEKATEHLDKISRSIDQATALATRFQTFSSGGDPVKEIIDVREVIRDAINIALSGSNHICNTEMPDNLHRIHADSKQINEVLMNLIINAQHAMPRGGKITISTENTKIEDNTIPSLSEGHYVKITVCDEGIGIPKKYLNDIFVPFFTTKAKGHGLGLSTVHFIIRKHKGAITVDSELNQGTVFRIYLPATFDELSSTEKAAKKVSGFPNKLNILIMDDEKDILDDCTELLSELNADVSQALNGYEAAKQFEAALSAKPFDIVILDLTIKGSDMDGEETLQKLKKIDPQVKAIVFSGHSNKPVVANYREYGFAGRIEKPINFMELVEEINRVYSL